MEMISMDYTLEEALSNSVDLYTDHVRCSPHLARVHRDLAYVMPFDAFGFGIDEQIRSALACQLLTVSHPGLVRPTRKAT